VVAIISLTHLTHSAALPSQALLTWLYALTLITSCRIGVPGERGVPVPHLRLGVLPGNVGVHCVRYLCLVRLLVA
jgi:hypothetical protein